MRLLTIYLILYLPQVTAGVAPCDLSIIKEITYPIVGFEFNNGILKCKDNKDIVITGHSVQYYDLKCDGSRNSWVYGSSPLTPATKADTELKFECKATACDISYIKGSVAEIKFIGGNLTCKAGMYIVFDGDRYDELTCDVHEGWKTGDKNLNIKSTNNLNIQCKGKACDKSYIKGVEQGKDAKYTNNRLRCTNPLQNIEFRGIESEELIPEVICDESKGWFFETEKEDAYNTYTEKVVLAKADEQIDVKCGATACNKMLISSRRFERLKPYDSDKKKLECKETFEHVLIEEVGKGRKHAEAKLFTCDPFGKWKNGRGKSTQLSATERISVICKVQACHKDLIDGTADKSDQDILKCDANKVLQIQEDSEFYKTLKCSDGKWFDPSDKLKIKVKPATEKFTIDCIPEPCTYQATGSAYDASTRTLTCHPGAIELGGKSYKSLTCDGRAGWSEDGGAVVAPAEPKLVVNCKHICTTNADVEYKMSSDGSYSVKCKEFAVMLFSDNGVQKEVKDMTCSKDGWKADNVNGISSYSKLEQLECKKACNLFQKPKDSADPDPTDNAKWEDGLTDLAKEISKGPKNVQFECNKVETPKYVIKMNEKLMDSHLNCDAGGYSGINGIQLASALDTVKIACVKICVTPTDVEYKISDDGSYAVTCKGIAIMEYDDGHGKKEVKDMRCSVDGWKRDGVKIGKPSDLPLQQLSCKRACYNHQKPKIDNSDPVKWEGGLTDFAEEISKGAGKVQFECKNKRFGDEKSVLKLNGKFVNSHLKCDVDGYTDIHGTKLADAFETVNIECFDSCNVPPEIHGGCKRMPEMPELVCYNSLFYVSYTNKDPYQLKCDPEKSGPQIIYDVEAKKFLENKPIMCQERDQYYFYGDANQGKKYNYESLLCVRKRCNTCEKLPNRGAGTGVDNYTPGTADKCATDKCPNNYWMIKRKDNWRDNEEEYVGEVICSSKHLGEWIINADSDNPTPISEGYCIASVTKKCTVEEKLITKCEDDWEKYPAYCGPLRNLDDKSYAGCGNYFKIFYKKKGAKYFEEGAESIKCNTTTGVWTVKKEGQNDELRKDDIVICGDRNPLPEHPSDKEHDSHAEMAAEAAQGGSSAVIGFSILGVILVIIIVLAIVGNRMMNRKPKKKQAQISNNEANKMPETPGSVNKDSKGVANEANSVHSTETPAVNPA